jgi:hypothetical protein
VRSSSTDRLLPLLLAALVAACATAPTGPDVAVMPGPGKTFEQFQLDDHVCRDHADRSLGPNAGQAGTNEVAKGAAVGTAGGAAAGALLGFGRPGAVVRTAGLGLILGSVIGASNAGETGQQLQRRYDIAYEQCMSAKGNQLPQTRTVTYYRYRNRPPPVVYYPPPGPPAPPPPP